MKREVYINRTACLCFIFYVHVCHVPRTGRHCSGICVRCILVYDVWAYLSPAILADCWPKFFENLTVLQCGTISAIPDKIVTTLSANSHQQRKSYNLTYPLILLYFEFHQWRRWQFSTFAARDYKGKFAFKYGILLSTAMKLKSSLPHDSTMAFHFSLQV